MTSKFTLEIDNETASKLRNHVPGEYSIEIDPFITATITVSTDEKGGVGSRNRTGKGMARRSTKRAKLRLKSIDAISEADATSGTDSASALTGYAAAVERGRRSKERSLTEAGGTYNTPKVCALLGVSRQAVRDRVRRNRLISVRKGSRNLYPVCQFDEDGVLPGLGEALAALDTDDPWLKLSWLIRTDRIFGKSPLQLLRDGDGKKALASARHFGEHAAL